MLVTWEHLQPYLALESTILDDRAVVAVTGEVDLSTAAEFRDAVQWAVACRDQLEVDLTHTTFMDGSGLTVLIEAYHRLGRHPQAIVIRSPGRRIQRLLDASGVASLFLIDDEPSTVPNDSPNRVNRAARIQPPAGSRQGAAAHG
jgi:anti-sigma B factor antagonist